tara:strand:- start:1921 stop:2208 length:288 start_codon:yes stop_codon:yes gene_type:complete
MTEHFLNNREITVLTLRFGLADGRSRTLENTAKELGPIESQLGGLRIATRERVRQIEAKAMRKLRRAVDAPTCCPECIDIYALISSGIKSKIEVK